MLHIVQPRVGDAQALYSWETSEEWIESIVNQAAAAHDKAIKPDAPLVPGSWCQFCRARPTCAAHMSMATQAISNAPESMSAIELAEAMRVAQILKTWIGDVFNLAQKELEAGASIPGWKLVTKKPRRVWANEADAEKAMRAAKVKVGDMFTKRLISPTQAEKLDKRLYAEKLSDIVVMHSSGVTVAPDSDKREAVTSATELLAAALPDKG